LTLEALTSCCTVQANYSF